MNDMKHIVAISNYFKSVTETLKKIDIESIDKAIQVIEQTVESEGNIYVIGNGGSASTASHLQSDFSNTVGYLNGKRINIYSLTDNVSVVTAIANDFSYDLIFKKQLEGRLKAGDLLIAISGSGNSKNILAAVEYANEMRANTLAMTGFDGGRLKFLSQINMHAPINDMQISEDIHLLFNHLITYIFNKPNKLIKYDS